MTAKVFFLHIPKTAGMSIRQILSNFYPENRVCPTEGWHDIDFERINFIDYDLLFGHFDNRILKYLPSTFSKVTFLRDPIHRTISDISHALREKTYYQGLQQLPDNFNAIIENDNILRTFCNVQTALLSASEVPLDSNSSVFKYHYGNINKELISVNKALDILSCFSFIGLQEDFENDLKKMLIKLKLLPLKKSQELNIAKKNKINPSDQQLSKIISFNNLDIQLYDIIREQKKLLMTNQINLLDARRFVDNSDQIVPGIDRASLLPAPFYGWGFYALEKTSEDGVSFRWSGPGLTSGIIVKPSICYESVVCIKYRLLPSICARNICVKFNGHEVEGRKLEHVDSFTAHTNYIDYIIEHTIKPNDLSEGFLEITFHADRVSETNTNDFRAVGFILSEAYIALRT